MSTITYTVIMCECGPKRLAMGLQQKQASDKRDKVSRMSPNSLDIWNSKTNKPIWQQIQDFTSLDSMEKLTHSTLLHLKKTFHGVTGISTRSTQVRFPSNLMLFHILGFQDKIVFSNFPFAY